MALEPECVLSANQNNFMCMICQDTMKDPHLVSCCSKSFCKSCISKLHERQKERTRCPNCSKQGFRSVLNLDLRNVIDDQLVYCHYKSAGCKWKGKRCEFEKHIKESCEYHMIECEYGCGQKYFRRNKKDHFASDDICLNSRLKQALATLQFREACIRELQAAVKIHQKKLEMKQNELCDLKQKFESSQKKGQRLENELQDSQNGRQMLESELQDLQRKKQKFKDDLQDSQRKKHRIKSELQTLQKEKKQIAIKQQAISFIFGIVIAVLLGYIYLHHAEVFHFIKTDVAECVECPPPAKCLQPPEYPLDTLSEFCHVITDIAEFVPVRYADTPWQLMQLWIEKYWHFNSVTVWIMKIGEAIYLKIRMQYTLESVERIPASVVVQVLNPSGYDHHVLRTNIYFQADTNNRTWYTGDTYKLLELTGENKKFYPRLGSLFKLRIVNIEVGANDLLPFHFSMCHVKYYQRKDKEWYTFPFYISKYKFMIYIYANGYGDSKGKALTLTVYRMKGETDYMIPRNIESGKITLKLGGRQTRELRIFGKAGKTVNYGGITVKFVWNHRFSRQGYRSEHGVSVSILHNDLHKYIDNDCFIFDVISGYMS